MLMSLFLLFLGKYSNSWYWNDIDRNACWHIERKYPIFNEDFYLPLYLPQWYRQWKKLATVDTDDSQQPTPDYWHLTTMQEPTTTTDSDTWQSAVRTRQSTSKSYNHRLLHLPQHSGIRAFTVVMIFQQHAYCISSTTPDAAVYWRAGCIPFHLHKFVKCRNVS